MLERLRKKNVYFDLQHFSCFVVYLKQWCPACRTQGAMTTPFLVSTPTILRTSPQVSLSSSVFSHPAVICSSYPSSAASFLAPHPFLFLFSPQQCTTSLLCPCTNELSLTDMFLWWSVCVIKIVWRQSTVAFLLSVRPVQASLSVVMIQ